MLDHDDPLDPELAALYAAEQVQPLPEGATSRVLAGVLAGISTSTVTATAASAATATSSGAATGLSTKAVIAIAVASAAGGGAVAIVGYRELASPPPVRQPAPAPDPAPRPDPIDALVPSIDATPAPVPADASRAQPSPARDHRVAPTAAEDTREPLLVDRARAALRRGLVDEALTTLMRHERIHPAGALAEERDVLIIEAYAAKGEPGLARRRIARYRREHPDGFLRARVDRVEAGLAP